jgi:hypothetical protein
LGAFFVKDTTSIGANFNGKVFIIMVWEIFPLKTRTLALIEAASFLFFLGLER